MSQHSSSIAFPEPARLKRSPLLIPDNTPLHHVIETSTPNPHPLGSLENPHRLYTFRQHDGLHVSNDILPAPLAIGHFTRVNQLESFEVTGVTRISRSHVELNLSTYARFTKRLVIVKDENVILPRSWRIWRFIALYLGRLPYSLTDVVV